MASRLHARIAALELEAAELRNDKAWLVEALETLLPGLALDIRYCSEDDDRDALKARVETVVDALNAAKGRPCPASK